MPSLRLEVDSLLVEGALMSPEAFSENVGRASCVVFVTSGTEQWPSPDALSSAWETWDLGPAPEALQAALSELKERAVRRYGWLSLKGEHVQVYTLGAGSPE